MLDHDAALIVRLARRPRLVPGEWCCLDCDHLSYGDSDVPRCPRCHGLRLEPTLGPSGERRDDRASVAEPATGQPEPARR